MRVLLQRIRESICQTETGKIGVKLYEHKESGRRTTDYSRDCHYGSLFFWCTTGERNTNQLINEFEQTLEEKQMKGQRLRKSKPPLVKRRKPFLKKAVSWHY